MPLGSPHLTRESKEQAWTYPGQAHFAIPGSEHHCFECGFWDPVRKSDKSAVCLKTAGMLRNPRRVPRQATICKYFEAKE